MARRVPILPPFGGFEGSVPILEPGLRGRGEGSMVEEAYEKVKEAYETGHEIGQQIDQATGASDKWSSAAVDADPQRAHDAADAWDRGDHLEAVGDFAVGTAEAAIDKIEDIL